MQDVYICHKPTGPLSPLVLDSPHSGRVYPADFGHACPKSWLEETEDSHVDALFSGAPALGIPLLAAQFPRCYIDANRAVDDIDPHLLDAPYPCNPSARTASGVGLIRRIHRQANPQPIYDRLLTVGELEHRINAYYRPYHAQLETLLEEAYAAFGGFFHLNCHSMPRNPAARTEPDIVLGDRDGTSCDPAFTGFAKTVLEQMGYRVAVNDPYKGVELVRKFSNPARNRHSLQIELRRGLYMNEATRSVTEGFTKLREDMSLFLGEVVDFARQNTFDLAAD